MTKKDETRYFRPVTDSSLEIAAFRAEGTVPSRERAGTPVRGQIRATHLMMLSPVRSDPSPSRPGKPAPTCVAISCPPSITFRDRSTADNLEFSMSMNNQLIAENRARRHCIVPPRDPGRNNVITTADPELL